MRHIDTEAHRPLKKEIMLFEEIDGIRDHHVKQNKSDSETQELHMRNQRINI